MEIKVILIPCIIFLFIFFIWFILWKLIQAYAREQVFLYDIMEKNKALIKVYKTSPVAYKVALEALITENKSCQIMMDRYKTNFFLKLLKPFIFDVLPENMKKRLKN